MSGSSARRTSSFGNGCAARLVRPVTLAISMLMCSRRSCGCRWSWMRTGMSSVTGTRLMDFRS